jgi:hypothetical protein
MLLKKLLIVAMIACFMVGVAWAGDKAEMLPADAYGYTADDVAVNQGVVLYWYAVGYARCFGCFPKTYAEMVEKGMPLRTFMSPHTGDAIDFDDGSLDYDGDITYVSDGCWPDIQVQTTGGVITLPGAVWGNSDVSVQFDPCCCLCLVNGCEDITICDIGCWDYCSPEDCICEVVQWMMWRSFELHEVLYGIRPANELAWYASGLAPVDKNYKEYMPDMCIEFIYKGKCYCDYLKKAYVTCCKPCCDPCDPCDPCKPKCDPCKPCCDPCKPCCEFKTCTPKPCKPKCDPCKPKCDPCKPKCDPCKPKCDPCKPKCDPCKPCCEFETCTPKPCKPKCDPCMPKCGKC